MTKTARRISIGLAIFIGVPLVYLVVTITFLVCSDWYYGSRLPQIGKDLPRNGASAKAEFFQRIQHKYPNPMPRDDLIRSLEAQGFQRSSAPDQMKEPSFMYFDWNSFPCDLTWSVDWKNQPDGRAYDIKGIYNYTRL